LRHPLARLRELPFRQALEVAAEECGADLLGLARRRVAVHQSRHLARQHTLRLALLRVAAHLGAQVIDRVAPEEREVLEEADDVGVAGVEPELVHLVGRRLRGIEPHGAALALPAKTSDRKSTRLNSSHEW